MILVELKNHGSIEFLTCELRRIIQDLVWKVQNGEEGRIGRIGKTFNKKC